MLVQVTIGEQARFLALLDELPEILSPAPPTLCGCIACPSEPGDPPKSVAPNSRMIIGLQGHDHHAVSVCGQRRDVVLRRGECIYFAAESWSIPFFDGEADVFSIVLLPWSIRFVRFTYGGGRPAKRQEYHSALPASPPAAHVARAMDSLAEQGNGTPIARDLLLVLLRLIRQQLADDISTGQTHWRTLMKWHSVREHIDQHFGRGVTRESVAQAFDLNASYLSTLAKRHSGQPFRQVLEGIRMSHARRLLQETNLKLASIAVQCGYRDVTRFAKVFRRFSGTTPGKFRAQRK